ncbi:hypothetical protein LNV09_20945 [Paucibacter sp. B2R-40]|uniref:ORC-CDC6 family AAA ATPase n=1 Tax=Paucibacter sp. B2R-40 TaxID=2893554 RepID=UPI0021E3F912|nr:hypothetical protein [Paucibacter sp. B2R-40]MCV2356615.1 hypothetical protein [Paucibacter sp. B2R-40]
MNAHASSAFFGAYNARHIDPEEVAARFVPSGRFWELIQARNSLLVGPRGSGKTHLLKMLQPKALAAWAGPNASTARSKVGFHGVFIPADINWRAQVDSRFSKYDSHQQSQYIRAVFLTNFREAFIGSLLQLTRDRPQVDQYLSIPLSINRESEASFCKNLAESWQLYLKIPSLDGLRIALVEELVHLGSNGGDSDSPYVKQLLNSNVITCAKQIAVHIAQSFQAYNLRWGLCFDELEIAPSSIQRELFAYLRSTDQQFLFKLAISPFNDESAGLNEAVGASVGNDFDAIPLWFTDSRERDVFCEELWDKQASHTDVKQLKPQDFLLRSSFQFANDEMNSGARRYRESSPWTQIFKDLEYKDRTFAKYLHDKGIRAAGLADVPRPLMDSVVRKIAPLVGFRNVYLTKAGDHSTRRILRSPPAAIFSGWDALCTATEGNPRWFCGVASKMMLKRSSSVSGRSITRDQQALEFQSAARKFMAWISAIPLVPYTTTVENPNSSLSLRDLVNNLGHYFSESALGKKFSADPVLSFEVDESTPEQIRALLVVALNVGAIVIMDDREVNFTLNSLVGHKFRLVHILAAHFNIPLRNGKSRKLSTILKETDLLRYSPKVIPSNTPNPQMGLF